MQNSTIEQSKSMRITENILMVFTIIGLGFQRVSVALGSISWGIALLCMTILFVSIYRRGGVEAIYERIAPFRSYFGLIGLFFLLLLPQILVSPYMGKAFTNSYGFFFWRMMPFLLGTMLLPMEKLKKIILAVSAIYMAESVTIVYEYMDLDYPRPHGFGENPLYVALQMAMVFPLFMIGAFESRFSPKWRTIAFIALLFVAVGLLFNNSRSTMLCAALLTVLITLIYSMRDKKNFLVGALMLLGAGFVIVHNPQLLERLDSIDNISTNSSNMARLVMWQDGMRIIADHPIFGTTAGAFKEIYNQFYFVSRPDLAMAKPYGHLHNNYIQLWAEYGVLVWIGYYALTAYIFVRNAVDYGKTKNPYALMIVMLLFAYSFFGIFEYAIYHTANNKIYWFLLGTLLLYKENYVEKR